MIDPVAAERFLLGLRDWPAVSQALVAAGADEAFTQEVTSALELIVEMLQDISDYELARLGRQQALSAEVQHVSSL